MINQEFCFPFWAPQQRAHVCVCVSYQASGNRMVYSCGEVVSGKLWRMASRCCRSSAPWYVNRMSRACTLLSCRQTQWTQNSKTFTELILNCSRKLPEATVQHPAIALRDVRQQMVLKYAGNGIGPGSFLGGKYNKQFTFFLSIMK